MENDVYRLERQTQVSGDSIANDKKTEILIVTLPQIDSDGFYFGVFI